MQLTMRKRPVIEAGEAAAIQAALARMYGIQPRLAVLDDGDLVELAELVAKATEHGGWNREALSGRETRKLEGLVELVGGLEAGHYEAERKAAKDRARFGALAAEARKMMRPSRQGELSFLETVFRVLDSRHLSPGSVTVLVTVLCQLHAGRVFAGTTRAAIEGSGPEARLVVNRGRGVTVAGSSLPRWRRHLTWLAKQGWLTVEERRTTYVIGVGAKTRAALREKRR